MVSIDFFGQKTSDLETAVRSEFNLPRRNFSQPMLHNGEKMQRFATSQQRFRALQRALGSFSAGDSDFRESIGLRKSTNGD